MKNLIYVLLLAVLAGTCSNPTVKTKNELNGKISVSGAWALYPMAVKWAEEFRKLHPDVQIDISAGGAGKGMTDVLNAMVDIGMVSRDVYPEEINKNAYPVAMVKDAVVAVVNENNPLINDILKTGLQQEKAIDIWLTGSISKWSQLAGTESEATIHVYTRSDACGAAEVWAKYLGKKQEDLLGSGVYGDPGLALAVQKDVLGIGYNNIGYAYDHTSRTQVEGIRVVPIDINNNGRIDKEESFYGTFDSVVNAIALNKYPSPPARELFFVTKGKSGNPLVTEFIRFALTEGQQYVKEAGYITLSPEKLAAELKKIQ
jgi:phosphate transport system substrate-binding protein